ncbi:MAG: twin-arginine translocation signal domain-containing protein [Chloroflexi bacterium]|nr:twin-arginine translocation signal domain-containing protein [Chloroflexota bacterium]
MATDSDGPAGTQQSETTAEVGRRQFLKRAGAAAAAGTVGAGVIGYAATNKRGAAKSLVCGYRAGDLPVVDPASAVWTRRSAFKVTMLVQNIATPHAPALVVPTLKVRALHNGTQIAFHLEWADNSKDELSGLARFNDAVAVQLAADFAKEAATGVTMGAVDNPVHILQWKASWQSDLDSGQKTSKDIWPNIYNDVRPEQLMPVDQAKSWYPGWAVGNPLSQRDKKSPVEEMVAVGFGTLTTHKEQEAVGKGIHDRNRWRVVIAMPMKGNGANKAQVTPGQTRQIAFAVWDGGEDQRGSRKQYALWVPMEVEAVA